MKRCGVKYGTRENGKPLHCKRLPHPGGNHSIKPTAAELEIILAEIKRYMKRPK